MRFLLFAKDLNCSIFKVTYVIVSFELQGIDSCSGAINRARSWPIRFVATFHLVSDTCTTLAEVHSFEEI